MASATIAMANAHAPAARASELLAAPRLVVGPHLGHQLVELARPGVALDVLVEQARIELLEPRPEFGQLLRRQPLDGLLDVLAHAGEDRSSAHRPHSQFDLKTREQ